MSIIEKEVVALALSSHENHKNISKSVKILALLALSFTFLHIKHETPAVQQVRCIFDTWTINKEVNNLIFPRITIHTYTKGLLELR